MYKSQLRAEQFLSRTGNFSTRGARTGLDLQGGGAAEKLTPTQQRDALVAAWNGLHRQLAEVKESLVGKLPYKVAVALRERREELGREILDINNQLAALNAARKLQAKDDLGRFIIEVVREQMTKPQWSAVISEAKRRFEASQIKFPGADAAEV